MIEFVYQVGKDTPEALAQELYNQQEAILQLKLDSIESGNYSKKY